MWRHNSIRTRVPPSTSFHFFDLVFSPGNGTNKSLNVTVEIKLLKSLLKIPGLVLRA